MARRRYGWRGLGYTLPTSLALRRDPCVHHETLLAPAASAVLDSSPSSLGVWVLPGVYAPAEDSRLLASVLAAEALDGARVLDLCTGTGLLAVTAAGSGASEVVAIDVSRRATWNARLNLWRHGGRARGRVRRGDLFGAVPDGGYDVIVSNPPYVPAEQDDLPTRGPARAWNGGRDGRAIVDRICAEAPRLLRPGGRLLMVHSGVTDTEESLRALRAAGLQARVQLRREINFGPVMQRRWRLLREAGLLEDDQRVEELVVVRAQRPVLRGIGVGA